MSIYDSERALNEYLLFHYGADDEVLPWSFGPRDALGFARRTVVELIDPSRLRPAARAALDLGCAVGRSSFELANYAKSVLGIDYSRNFIAAAAELAAGGGLCYERVEEGKRRTVLTAHVPAGLTRERVRFEQGDAANLDARLANFEVVHAANLLCRLAEPEKLLERLPALVARGGQLLLTTPCTWLEEFTPRPHWPHGSTRDWLHEKLGAAFDLAFETDMPFLIREHARKFQWSVALAMRWIRRG